MNQLLTELGRAVILGLEFIIYGSAYAISRALSWGDSGGFVPDPLASGLDLGDSQEIG